MKITIKKLCQDTYNFIYNNHIDILILILITIMIHISLNYIMFPKKEELTYINDFIHSHTHNALQTLSTDQQYILIKLFIANNIPKFISNTFLLSNILTMLYFSSIPKTNLPLNILQITKSSISIFPKLLIFIFFITLFIEIGLMFAIIPGISLAIITSLTPIITITENISIIKAMRISAKLSLSNIYFIAPIISFWFATKIIITLVIIYNLDTQRFIARTISETLNNVLSLIILIYLYRLYMLIKNNVDPLKNNGH